MAQGSEHRKKKAIWFLCATGFILAALGVTLFVLATSFKSQSFKPTDFVNQVATDWQQTPFVEIQVVSDTRCPNDTELVIERVWYGSRQGCYCDINTRVFAYDVRPSQYNSTTGIHPTRGVVTAGFKLDRECTFDEMYNTKNHLTCWNVPGQPPVIQGQFFGKRVCGKKGGLPFSQVVRPVNGTCPEQTKPCTNQTSPEKTICYPPSEHAQKCPINGLNIVDQSQVEEFKKKGYKTVKYGQSYLAYSKNETSLPITSIRVDGQPCIDPNQQSNSYEKAFYITEVMQQSCRPEYSTGETFDSRYYEFEDWQTEEYTVQTENGVLDILKGLANFDAYVKDLEEKKQNIYKLYGRPTVGWSLQCESNGFTREQGLAILGKPLRSFGRAQFVQIYGIILFTFLFVPLTGFCMPKKSGLICLEIMFCLSRFVSAVAFYAMYSELLEERTIVNTNLAELEGYKSTNECVDPLSQVNVPKASNDLKNAGQMINLLYYITMACVLLTIFEFIWICPYGETVRQSKKQAKKKGLGKKEAHEEFENEIEISNAQN